MSLRDERVAAGAFAGATAWWAMDHVLRFLYDHEARDTRRRETRARGGVPALEVLAQRSTAAVGVVLAESGRQRAGKGLQWAVGMGMGVLYATIRHRMPAGLAGRGLAFGAAASVVIDEGLVPLLGLSPGPGAFPWQTHARGLAGHLVFGTVAELCLHLLDRRLPRALLCGVVGVPVPS